LPLGLRWASSFATSVTARNVMPLHKQRLRATLAALFFRIACCERT
jgi:hypothetical protein